MSRPLIRNKIITYFLITVTLTIWLFGLYMLSSFRKYGEKVLIGLLTFRARQFEQEIHYSWNNNSDSVEELASLVINMGSIAYSLHTEVIDKDGNILAASNSKQTNTNAFNDPEIKNAFATGERAADIRTDNSFSTQEDEPFAQTFFVAVPIRTIPPNQYVLRISSPGTMLEEGLIDITLSMLFSFVIVTLLAFFISHRLASNLLKPLGEITQVADKISKGNLREKVHYQGDNEFGLLADTLNNLSTSLSAKIKELSAEKQKQELILEQMDNIVILVNRQGNIESINHRGRYVFHDKQNTYSIGKHNLEVIGSPMLEYAIRECFSTLASKIIDLSVTRNSVEYIFQVHLSPLTGYEDKKPSTVLVVFHDITTLLKVYEKQIDFIANASHELATPLTSIKGFSETLLDGALESPELSEKFVKIIYEESDHMQKLVKDLLQLSRLDSREYRQTITMSAFESRGIFENIKDRLAHQIEEKNLEVKLIYKKDPQAIIANPDWFKQALINLIENAIKYSPISGCITLTYNNNEDYAIFSIEDQGLGIAPENLPYIFDRFYRAEKSRTKSKISGTGIGLSIVKFAVELFGGTINVESQLNVGSKFTVTVPLAKDEDIEIE